MHYISIRGKAEKLGFEDILTSGLARDGGLYMPETIPHVSLEEIYSWDTLSYQELAQKVITPFIGDAIPADDLAKIIAESYSEFRDPKIAPVREVGDNHYLLELFHGPTLAFKDYALQLLGRLLDYILTKHDEHVVIVGATSGDTGSAAIEGCRHSDRVKMFILHPHGRTSDVQRRQMTTVNADNIFNLAVEGTFDDCQDAVKAMFNAPEFAAGSKLVAVNSINWARIMAQIVYYFSAYLQLGKPNKIAFSVPTGNFGDVFAGYMATRMGLPVSQLVVATNTNDILHRFFTDNDYSKSGVVQTLSPSMDIQISSNFERLLFDLYNNDGNAVQALMDQFNNDGKLTATPEVLEKARAIFTSFRLDDDGTLGIIKEIHDTTGITIDPHTAIGLAGAMSSQQGAAPMVTVATAHPAKFPAAIEKAGAPPPTLPDHLADLMEREERFDVVKNDLGEIQDFIKEHIG